MIVYKFPLISCCLFLIVGITIGNQWHISALDLWPYLTGLILVLLIIHRFYHQFVLCKIWFKIIACLFTLTLGIHTIQLRAPENNKEHLIHYITPSTQIFYGSITENLKSSRFYDQYYASIKQIDTHKVEGKLLVKIKKEPSSSLLATGDLIFLAGTAAELPKTKNPAQFDYADYLETKGIYAQLTLDNSAVKKIGSNLDFFAKVFQWRKKIEHAFEHSGLTSKNIAILKALIVGQKQNIDSKTMNDFSSAGAIHLLAISGLHVGILMYLFRFILQPLGKIRHGKKIQLFLIIIFLWLFACMAGLSASVVRAVTMFSFLSVGLYYGKLTNIYNTLCSAAFVMLLFNPYFLFDVGFQLSFSAVLAIVSFYPLLSQYWLPKNKVVKYFYDIILVSFVAQVGVLPLSLFYFHQFPGLFFITNLVAIPLVTLILISGIISIPFLLVGILKDFWSTILETILNFLRLSIEKIAGLDQFIIKDIYFSITYLVISYVIIYGFYRWLFYQKTKAVYFLLGSIICFQVLVLYQYFYTKPKEWILYHSMRNTSISYFNGQDVFVFSNDTVKNQYVKPWESYALSINANITNVVPIENVYEFNGEKVLILDKFGVYPRGIKPDILIVSGGAKLHPERVLQELSPKKVIIAAQNHKQTINYWQKYCAKNNTPYYNCHTVGYYKKMW